MSQRSEKGQAMTRLVHGQFTITRIRPGYAIAEVDDFIARIEGTLGGAPLSGEPVTAEDVRRGRLPTPPLSAGVGPQEEQPAIPVTPKTKTPPAGRPVAHVSPPPPPARLAPAHTHH